MCTVDKQINKMLSKEGIILIKVLRVKRYGAKKIIIEF